MSQFTIVAGTIRSLAVDRPSNDQIIALAASAYANGFELSGTGSIRKVAGSTISIIVGPTGCSCPLWRNGSYCHHMALLVIETARVTIEERQPTPLRPRPDLGPKVERGELTMKDLRQTVAKAAPAKPTKNRDTRTPFQKFLLPQPKPTKTWAEHLGVTTPVPPEPARDEDDLDTALDRAESARTTDRQDTESNTSIASGDVACRATGDASYGARCDDSGE